MSLLTTIRHPPLASYRVLFFLKTLAPVLMALGSIILAIRVKKILDALVQAVAAAEKHRLKIVEHIVNNAPLRVSSECAAQVRNCQRIGIGTLVVGFVLIAVGALISGFNVFMAGL